MNLYQIDRAIMELQDPVTGELSDMDALESLMMDKDRKIESVALYIKNLTAEADAIRREISALQERMESCIRQIDRMTNYLSDHIGPDGFESPKCAVRLTRSKRVELDDEPFLIRWLEMTGNSDGVSYGQPKPRKDYIKKLIASGVEVPHARVTEHKGVSIK